MLVLILILSEKEEQEGAIMRDQPQVDSYTLDVMQGRIPRIHLTGKCRDCAKRVGDTCMERIVQDPRFCMGPFLRDGALSRFRSSECKKGDGWNTCPYCGGKAEGITKSVFFDDRAKSIIDPCWRRCLECRKEWRSDEFKRDKE